MNFQAVSVGEKLPVGGYLDASGTPSALLARSLGHVDAALGKMVAELTKKGLFDSTLIIVTAKHGQSPIDRTRLSMKAGGNGQATVEILSRSSTRPTRTSATIPRRS
jgi:predicted AlkP superfamily pyrophosphatase or phosphodiesterase